MKKTYTLFIFLLLGVVVGVNAQDTHFSQFYASPLNLNPALTGNMDASYRATAIYRNQDRSFTTPYVTYSASFDIKPIENLTGNDIFAIGAVFLGDRSGSGELMMNNVMISAAYHKSIGRKHLHHLGIGVQGGFTQKSVNWNLSFPDQHVADYFDLNHPSGEVNYKSSLNYFDLNAGALYQGWIKPNDLGVFAGLSFAHLTSPKQSFFGDGDRLPLRYTFHAGVYAKVANHVYLTPNFMFLYQDKALEANLGLAAEYHMDPKKLILFLGVWDRAISTPLYNDAVIVSGGLEYSKFRASFAYDITTSNLSAATQNRSAFEIALIYTGFIKSKELQFPVLVPSPRM